MACDQTYFSTARNVGTIYVDREGDNLADVRFCLCRFGEDVNLCIEAFWNEQPRATTRYVRYSPTASRLGLHSLLSDRLLLPSK
jgi:hypothetical protein